jgi:hypothetical protein
MQIQTRRTRTGPEFDAETGLYYYRARYYDQNVGRFYAHSVPDSKRRAVANVAALLFPSVPPQGKEHEGRQELGS